MLLRKGEEFKAFYYTSIMALCNNYITIYNIIPNTNSSFFVYRIAINIKNRHYSTIIK